MTTTSTPAPSPPPSPTTPSPEFVRPSARPPRTRGAWWPWLLVPVLTSSLLVQIAVADRARLARDPVWRPRIVTLCNWLRCTVPAWREPGALKVTSREVRPHPSAPGVLLVTATFRNDAAFAQAWPVLQLSLANLDGDALGLRRFTPREYLGSEPATAQIGPGQSASITLEIVDPGKRAVAFNFEFR
ncbi:MAG: DUF3426 domain-containing protein [Arenimonas sp.]|jgi:hypothetical protein